MSSLRTPCEDQCVSVKCVWSHPGAGGAAAAAAVSSCSTTFLIVLFPPAEREGSSTQNPLQPAVISPSFQSDNAWTLRLPSMHPHNHKTISSAGQRMSMRCTITEERGEVSGTNSITDFCHLLPVYFSYSTYVRAASINLIWSLSSSLRVKWVHILIDSMELGWGGCASGLRL